ncbi:MAG: hypothetical protein D3909_00190 [Candidatus Electrothrix sp. ATG1]|nr:hypothetical protein [Candidatus Electrothrix sp. ATG1]
MGGLSSFFFFEIGVIYLSYTMTPSVKGPAFLFYYFVLWFILLAAAKLNKWKVLFPIIIYFSAGISRYFIGQEHGMARFGGLWAMMIGGPVVYLILAIILHTGGGAGGDSGWLGCGGGCGSDGGCGGGGGCGGCGGD